VDVEEAQVSAVPMSQQPQPQAESQVVRGAVGAWWGQGCRTALFMRPEWRGLVLSPAIVACLAVSPLLLGLGLERLAIEGPALFHGPGLFGGWLHALLSLWLCWWLFDAAHTTDDSPGSAVAMFSMLSAQAFFIKFGQALVILPLLRGGFSLDGTAWWVVWGAAVGWSLTAQVMLLWRSGSARVSRRIVGCGLLALSASMHAWYAPGRAWYPDARAAAASSSAHAESDSLPPFRLTQEVIEEQPRVLARRLADVKPGRAGVVDVFAITFAPYADEDVFSRESAMVAELMQQRFGARGKTVQLINHRRTVGEWPWATPLNLQRAIQHAAKQMNRDEDILFLHLTSHGARNGKLAAEFDPLTVDSVTPQRLKQWLDDAGVRFRIVSVSACYSGSWIPPLQHTGTLVMTAADADHTSYGCGRGSELTYFGRAMFNEQLRSTWSFEAAHAAARTVIEKREKEAGKQDGYSNPQIAIGDSIRPQLARLEQQRRAAQP
jgi:hypothetical protein